LVFKMDKDLYTGVFPGLNFGNFWTTTVDNSNNDEIFFRIIHDKDNEYSIGGYFIPNGQTNHTISNMKIIDNGSSFTIGNHSYLNPISAFAESDIKLIDMESDLACGSLFLVENVNPAYINDNSTDIVRTYMNNFGCYNNILSDNDVTSVFMWTDSKNIFEGELTIIDPYFTLNNDAIF